jgi:lipoate-protein ligase A
MSTVEGEVLNLLPYDLPDAVLLGPSSDRSGCLAFVPSRTVIVIGKGSDPAAELYVENAVADRVPVMRRATGGCAVVLTPEMVSVSFVLYHQRQRKSSEYFRLFNSAVIHALESLGVQGLEHVGTSDIALSLRKVAGAAIYRNRQRVFYHTIINVRESADLMERYLRMPPREPPYRAGRRHAEFVTSLEEAGFGLEIGPFDTAVSREFARLLERLESA